MAGKRLLILAGGGGGTGPGGGGGGITGEEAPPVSISSATVREIYNGDFEIDVFWSPNALATPDNFVGVAVFVEDPDISSGQEAPLDNTKNLDGTSQMSGKWQPVREDDSYVSPASMTVPGGLVDRDVRVYLLAFGKGSNGKLVRQNDPSGDTATPNVVVSVPKMADKYVSGHEHAWNITNPFVLQTDKFDDPAGPMYSLTFNYTKPDLATPLPPGMKPFGGVEIFYQYDPNDPSTQTDSGVSLPVDEPGPWTSPDYPAVGTGTFQVWFVSMDIDHNMNTIVPGVTPEVDVTVVYPPMGEASAPDVTGFLLSNPRFESTFDGSILAKIDADWTIPNSPRYGGMTIYVVSPVSAFRLLLNATEPMAHATLQVIDYPPIPQDWTLAAISVDFANHAAADPHVLPLPSHIPTQVWHNIGPPGPGSGGQEYTSLVGVTGVTITTEQQLGSDGVVIMRHKIVGWTNPTTDNSFGGVSIARVYQGDTANATWWDAQKTDTSLTTPWEPAPGPRDWDFYFVSRNQQNKRNSLLPGFTPVVHVTGFAPMSGHVIPSRLPPEWWDTSEFAWPTGLPFAANQFAAQKIYVGSILRVGGGPTAGVPAGTTSFGGNQNGQIAVFNSSNVLRGWIGQQDNTTPDQPTTVHTIFGAWFSELYVGGDGPPSAPIYATQAGVVIIGGWDVQGTRYPYISIKDKFGVEVGRIGANVGINLVGSTDQAYIQGAWFRDFAFGGQGLADWRFLAKYDSGTGLSNVQMRNINKFAIDYAQNYIPPGGTSNPNNAQNHFELGYDSFVTDSPTGAKFPGLSLYRTFTQHGVSLINRGLVLRNAGGLRVGALVSFNGDSLGGDTANGGLFWGQFTLNNPNTGVPTITMSSGSSGGAVQPSIFMTEATATTTYFAADTVNAVTCRLGVTTGAGLVIDSSNNIVGAAIHSNSGYLIGGTGPATTGILVIDSGGNFVGRGVSMNGPGGTINTVDDVHARNYFAGYPSPNTLVINSSGQFVGSLAPSTLTVSGAMSANSVTANSVTSNGAVAVNNNSLTVYSGSTQEVVLGVGGGIYAHGQIQSDGGYTSNISGWGFATGGSEDVVVGGVTLHFRGGIYAGHS
jgi:hypothetical protein